MGVAYDRRMGSSGMKRKGRTHLPKVGTRPNNERQLHERRSEALHPFSSDPSRRRGAGYGIIAIVVVAIVVIGIFTLIAVT